MIVENFQYEKLVEKTNEIRLITLLPGHRGDDIRITISHTSLETPILPSRNDALPSKEVQPLLAGWDTCQALDGRILYVHENGRTSWECPGSNIGSRLRIAEDPDKYGKGREGYEALSYIWGPEKDECQVIVETLPRTEPPQKKRLAIRRNLFDALQHLRYDDAERTLWVDSVCIDQTNMLERNEQVARMKDIFESASKVLVWLGPTTDNSHLAMTTLGHLGRQAVFTKDRKCILAPDAVEKEWRQPTFQLPFDDKTWAAIGDLLKRSWFERLWVLQEIHLARKAVFLCGEDTVDWPDFRYAILILWYNKSSLWSLPAQMRLAGQLAESTPEKHPISDILYQIYGRFCSLNHDRVYGIHGLFPPAFQKLIPPEYSFTSTEVYRSLVVAHVRYYERLELLRLCQWNLETTEKPSWVPNLSSTLKVSRRMDWQFAAGYSRSQAQFEGSDKLNVIGVHCATLSKASDPVPYDADLLQCFHAVRSWEPADMDSRKYPTGESVRDAYARTLLGNAVQDRLPERVYDETLANWRVQDSETALFGAAAATPISGDIKLSGVEKSALSWMAGRTFVTTSNGYFGIAPFFARPDDIICVLLGCEAPMLLRPCDEGTFQVMGECFIHGLNDATGILGPLPHPWIAQVYQDPTGLFTNLRFYNPDNDTTTNEDPRLGPLPREWELVDHERTADKPRIFASFRNKATGEIMNSDPRLLPDALKAQGVDLRTFSLI